MPIYVYKCAFCGSLAEVIHPMEHDEPVTCSGRDCGNVMHRVPQIVRVNWNGPRPSDWELDPALKEHADNLDRGQADYQAYKEKYYENRRNVLGSDEV